MQNLAGVLDGPHFAAHILAVSRTKAAEMRRLDTNGMFMFLYHMLFHYNTVSKSVIPPEASAAEIAELLTATVVAKNSDEGTLRSCYRVVLTFETLCIVAAILLLLIFILLCSLSFIKSPEALSVVLSKGDAFESWNLVLKWSMCLADGIVILGRNPELKLNITAKENTFSACTCTASEIKSVF